MAFGIVQVQKLQLEGAADLVHVLSTGRDSDGLDI